MNLEIGTSYKVVARSDSSLADTEPIDGAVFIGEKSIWFPAQRANSIERKIPIFEVGTDRLVAIQPENIVSATPSD